MADKSLKLDLTIATKDAEQNLKNTSKAAQDLSTDVEQIKTKGQIVAESMSALADEVEAEFEQAKAASDELGNALGSEFKSKVEKAGGSVDEMVAKLRKAGLTYDEIKADADALADSIKRVDEAGTRLDSTGGRARALGLELDQTNQYGSQTRSVMANLTGNAAQDMGQLAGVTGTTGVAIGQLAEYAADGNVSLKGIAAAAPGIALVGFAMSKVAERAQKIAEVKAFEKERVKGYFDALRDGQSDLEAIESTLREMGKIQLNTHLGGLTIDLQEVMAELGVTAETFAQMVGGSREQIDEWGSRMKAAGANANDVNGIMIAAVQEQERFAEATKLNAEAVKVWGESEATKKAKLDEAKKAQETYADKIREGQERVEDFNEAEREAAEALDKSQRSARAARETQNDLEQAHLRAARAADTQRLANEKLAGELSDEAAYLNLAQQFADLEQAAKDVETAIAEGTMSVEEGMRQQALDVNAAKQAVLEYGTQIGGISPQKQVVLTTLVDQGKYQQALDQLKVLEQNRTMELSIITKGGLGFVPPSKTDPRHQFAGGFDTSMAQPSILAGATIYGADADSFRRIVIEAIKEYQRTGGVL